MDGHGVLHPERLFAPHGAVDALGREHGAGGPHEQVQDVILPGGERHGVAVQGDFLRPVVQGDAPQAQGRGADGAAAQLQIPAKLRLDPRQDLHGVEGLGDIVVRPQIQALNFVRVLGFGREQDHRHVGRLPQAGQGGDAVQLGHHDVQQDQVDVLPAKQVQGLRPVVGGEDLIPGGGQIDGQCGHNVLFVVAD